MVWQSSVVWISPRGTSDFSISSFWFIFRIFSNTARELKKIIVESPAIMKFSVAKSLSFTCKSHSHLKKNNSLKKSWKHKSENWLCFKDYIIWPISYRLFLFDIDLIIWTLWYGLYDIDYMILTNGIIVFICTDAWAPFCIFLHVSGQNESVHLKAIGSLYI